MSDRRKSTIFRHPPGGVKKPPKIVDFGGPKRGPVWGSKIDDFGVQKGSKIAILGPSRTLIDRLICWTSNFAKKGLLTGPPPGLVVFWPEKDRFRTQNFEDFTAENAISALISGLLTPSRVLIPMIFDDFYCLLSNKKRPLRAWYDLFLNDFYYFQLFWTFLFGKKTLRAL